MNFIKRVGSFAFSSWRDFSDYHHDQKTLDLDCSEDTQSDKTNISDIKIEKEGDDHVDDIIRRKPLHGFFKKRFSKKKLVVLDDPRSPTKEFERTLIQVESDSPNNGLFSPFNIQEMLDIVQTAVDSTPTKPLISEQDSQLNTNQVVDEKIDSLSTISSYDWDQVKCQERILSESLIVEVSSLDINSISESALSVLELIEETGDIVTNDQQNENKNCKVVGYTSKATMDNENDTLDKTHLSTSTPKKASKKLIENPQPRTPLKCIKNSPLVKIDQMNKDNGKSQFDKNKKKFNSSRSRRLPKAPSTPMTPLYKSSKCVSHFDKENF